MRLWSWIKNLFTTKVPEKVLRAEYEVHRLSAEAYAELEQRLPKIGTPRNSEEACTLVGIQMVLAELRRGYVIG